jgi:hypothetical protein
MTLRRENCARIVMRSEAIAAKFSVTGVSFDRTIVTYVATGAISGATGVTRDIK